MDSRPKSHRKVQGLYAAAGLDLDADPGAAGYLSRNIIFDGQLNGRPVLTLPATGDGWVAHQGEQAYRSAVQDAKDAQLPCQAFVHRAGTAPSPPPRPPPRSSP
jgi:hypothetical protein